MFEIVKKNVATNLHRGRSLALLSHIGPLVQFRHFSGLPNETGAAMSYPPSVRPSVRPSVDTATHHEVDAELVERHIELLERLLVRVLLPPRHRPQANLAND